MRRSSMAIQHEQCARAASGESAEQVVLANFLCEVREVVAAQQRNTAEALRQQVRTLLAKVAAVVRAGRQQFAVAGLDFKDRRSTKSVHLSVFREEPTCTFRKTVLSPTAGWRRLLLQNQGFGQETNTDSRDHKLTPEVSDGHERGS